MSLFKQAAQQKLRFPTQTLGDIATEDLWDLPLTSTRGPSLDSIAKALHKKLTTSEISFVEEGSAGDEETKLKLDIVKEVISDKKLERDARALASEKRAEREKIMQIMAMKQDQKLTEASEEDLARMLNELSS
jgi:hypothetical protein